MILFAKSVAQLDWDDKMFHYVLVLATIIVGHVAKAGFDWLGSKLWNKALTISAKDYAAFHAWKKTQVELASREAEEYRKSLLPPQ